MYYNPTPSPISPASYMDPVPETGVTSIEQRYPMSSHNGVVIRSTETVSNEADFSPNNYEELTRWVLQQTLPPIQTGELASPYLHSMLLYIDQNGKLGREASPSMASYVEDVFTPEVAATFLKMASIASQREFRRASESFANPGGSFVPQMKGSISDPKQFTRSQSYPLLSSQTCPPGWYQHGLSRQPELIPCEWQSQPRKRRRRNNAGYMNNRLGYALDGTGTLKHTIQRTALKVSNRPLLRKYYEKGFEAFQQTNCKVIAKAFVKVVEPRKQVNHPYNGRIGPFQRVDPEFTKPDWWPTGVIHKEPDHLLKPGKKTQFSCTTHYHLHWTVFFFFSLTVSRNRQSSAPDPHPLRTERKPRSHSGQTPSGNPKSEARCLTTREAQSPGRNVPCSGNGRALSEWRNRYEASRSSRILYAIIDADTLPVWNGWRLCHPCIPGLPSRRRP